VSQATAPAASKPLVAPVAGKPAVCVEPGWGARPKPGSPSEVSRGAAP